MMSNLAFSPPSSEMTIEMVNTARTREFNPLELGGTCRRLCIAGAMCIMAAIPALGAPDLILRKLEIRDTHTLKIFVSNNGDQDSGAFAVRVSAIDAHKKVLRIVDQQFPSVGAHQFREADVQIDLSAAARVVAVADIGRSVTETDESNNVQSAEIPVSVAAKEQKVIKISKSSGTPPQAIVLPPVPSGDLAVTGINFTDEGGKDRVVVVIRNAGNVPWKEGKRVLTLRRTVMKEGGQPTVTVGSLTALPDLAPGETWARAFDRPPEVNGARSYRWEATLAPGDGNPANDHFSLTRETTKFD